MVETGREGVGGTGAAWPSYLLAIPEDSDLIYLVQHFANVGEEVVLRACGVFIAKTIHIILCNMLLIKCYHVYIM